MPERFNIFIWLIVLCTAVFVYAVSFASFSVIENKHDVLADADTSEYVFLLKNFRIDKQIGNPWKVQHRSTADTAQKHKVHHVVYAAVGHAGYEMLAPVYDFLGWGRNRAVFGVNAIIAGINIILLAMLLRRNNPNSNTVLPFVLFYCIALSTWIYSSVPESWPFSATLVLLFFLLLEKRPLRPMYLGVTIGLIMLNNVYLAALLILLVFAIARDACNFTYFLRDIVIAGGTAAFAWLGGLTVLSCFDVAFRPDEFVRYTLWFKQFVYLGLPRTDPYVWKAAITNLFINSFVSNQPDPKLPMEALQITLSTSVMGTVATIAYVAVVCVAFWGFIRSFSDGLRLKGARSLLDDPSVLPILWCVCMLAVTVMLYYASGFLYSTIVVPILIVLFCRHLDLKIFWQRLLFYTTLIVIMSNNIDQIVKFRDALFSM